MSGRIQLKKIYVKSIQTKVKRIIRTVEQLQEPQDSWVNVRKLRNHQYDYRLTIGRYRVLFDYDNKVKIIRIERVKKRDGNTY